MQNSLSNNSWCFQEVHKENLRESVLCVGTFIQFAYLTLCFVSVPRGEGNQEKGGGDKEHPWQGLDKLIAANTGKLALRTRLCPP